MITDTALEYNGKLLKINKMINDLETLGFDLLSLKNKVDEINSKVLSDLNTKEGSHEFEIISIYTNGIKDLTKIDAIIDNNYSVYFKIYYYALYILELDITKDNIDEIANSLKKIIDKLHNTSNIVYDKEKTIVETVYEAIYKVIKSEILIKGNSKIYDYTKIVDVDSYYLHNLVKKELDGIDLDKYPDIKRLIYKINSSNFDSNYFDIELIKEIIFKDKKEELGLIAQKNINHLATQIKVSDYKCLETENKVISSNNKKNKIESKIRNIKVDIAKKIVALSLASSIPIGVFWGIRKVLVVNSDYFCDVETKTYNSYFDSTQIDKNIISVNDISDDQNQRIVVKRYFPYVMSEKPYREIETYNLPYNEEYNFKDYIEDINDSRVLPNKEIELMGENSLQYNNDYFEVIYRYVDFESKHVPSIEVILNFILPLVLSLLIAFVQETTTIDFNSCKGVYERKIKGIISNLKEIIELKGNKKEQVRNTIQNVKVLLDEIKSSKELRELFNNELAKHPELIERATKELINYKPREETVEIVKKLTKNKKGMIV